MANENVGNRTRMNFAQDAKGFVKMDLTVEYETPELTEENAKKAIDAYKRVCEEKGLKLLQPTAA
jgi:organic hydroperoxide reductase OsmC/OhrA